MSFGSEVARRLGMRFVDDVIIGEYDGQDVTVVEGMRSGVYMASVSRFSPSLDHGLVIRHEGTWKELRNHRDATVHAMGDQMQRRER